MTRNDDGAVGGTQTLEQVDQVHPLSGIETGERFVEDEDLGVVDDRLGDLDALTHALRERRQPTVVAGIQVDLVQGACGRRRRIR